MADAINPSHYKQGKVECIDAIESATANKTGLEAVCVGNVIKYIWRYEAKNGLEDCKKAHYYLNKLIACLEEKENKIVPKSNKIPSQEKMKKTLEWTDAIAKSLRN